MALAETIGIDRTYQSQIEQGIANPSLEVLCSIANGLGVDFIELFPEEDNE